MEAALLGLAMVACPLGMLAMMGGMAWMARRPGSEKRGAAGAAVADESEATRA